MIIMQKHREWWCILVHPCNSSDMYSALVPIGLLGTAQCAIHYKVICGIGPRYLQDYLSPIVSACHIRLDRVGSHLFISSNGKCVSSVALFAWWCSIFHMEVCMTLTLYLYLQKSFDSSHKHVNPLLRFFCLFNFFSLPPPAGSFLLLLIKWAYWWL